MTIDFDPAVISYEGILDAFFRCHDAAAGGRSRQYASIIFAHDESQLAAANKAVAERPGVKTTVEEAVGERGLFWVAEAYHQKWLLQRKRPLFLALGMMERGAARPCGHDAQRRRGRQASGPFGARTAGEAHGARRRPNSGRAWGDLGAVGSVLNGTPTRRRPSAMHTCCNHVA